MKISILLTLLLLIISLGRLICRAGELCLIEETQINGSENIKYTLLNVLSVRAVKFIWRGVYLLNTVTLFATQKAAQTIQIQSQNIEFEG